MLLLKDELVGETGALLVERVGGALVVDRDVGLVIEDVGSASGSVDVWDNHQLESLKVAGHSSVRQC